MMSYESVGPVATTLPYHIASPQSYSYTRESAHQPGVAVPVSKSSHQHSRSSSSSAFPTTAVSSYHQRTIQNPLRSTDGGAHSRQPSASGSISSGVNQTPNMAMHRAPTSGSTSSLVPRRSTSSRSSTGTSTPTSYVALMRKQKATVWCDRSQSLDGRTLAAQKAAKARAIREVSGPMAASGRTSTVNSGGVVGKIRHGGVPRAPGYIPAGNLSGAGVPMRLSANEMLGDEEEEEASSMHQGDNAMVHGRDNGSGRSSTNSAKYRSGYPRPDPGRFPSQTSTPSASGNQSPQNSIPEHRQEDEQLNNEEEDHVTEMQSPSAVNNTLKQVQNADDLRRRGSVDERAMSMGAGVRLFVANPDVDE